MKTRKTCGCEKSLAEWILISRSLPSDSWLYFRGQVLSPQERCLLVCQEDQYEVAMNKGFRNYVSTALLIATSDVEVTRGGKHFDFLGITSALNSAI